MGRDQGGWVSNSSLCVPGTRPEWGHRTVWAIRLFQCWHLSDAKCSWRWQPCWRAGAWPGLGCSYCSPTLLRPPLRGSFLQEQCWRSRLTTQLLGNFSMITANFDEMVVKVNVTVRRKQVWSQLASATCQGLMDCFWEKSKGDLISAYLEPWYPSGRRVESYD